jgi:hypothetical protein
VAGDAIARPATPASSSATTRDHGPHVAVIAEAQSGGRNVKDTDSAQKVNVTMA